MTTAIEREVEQQRGVYWALFLLAVGLSTVIVEHSLHPVTYYLIAHSILIATLLTARHCSLPSLLTLGVILRIAASCVPAFTTNDIYRYLWDGAVANLGIDPYRIAPESVPIATGFPLPPDHQSLTTVYPPIALLLFQFCALLSPSSAYWLWKGLCCGASLASLFLVYRLIDPQERFSQCLLVCSPLLIFESCIGAHLDGIACMFVCATLLAQRREQAVRAGMYLALTLGIKTSYAILVPVFGIFWMRQGMVKETSQGFLLIILLMATYCLGMGFLPIGSLFHVLQHWSFGSPVYTLTSSAGLSWLARILFFVALAFLPWIIAFNHRLSLSRKIIYVFGTLFMVSPVCYPWYVLLPTLLLSLSWSPILFLWSSVLPFTYEVIIAYGEQQRWNPAFYPLWLIALAWVIGSYYEYQGFHVGERGGGSRNTTVLSE